jgi:hypothetical protein
MRDNAILLLLFAAGFSAVSCSGPANKGAQEKVAATQTSDYRLGDTIDFTSPSSNALAAKGWSGVEPGWGTWSDGSQSELTINAPDAAGRDLIMEADVRPFTPAKRPRFDTVVKVNGSQAGVWHFDALGTEPVHREVEIPKSMVSGPTLRIVLNNSDPRSPNELGISSDTRKLSLALVRLKISAHQQ